MLAVQASRRASETETSSPVSRLAVPIPSRSFCSSTRAWLASEHRLSHGHAKGLVARATAMTPRTEATRIAWANGELSGEQAEAIAAAVNGLGDRVPFGRAEAAEAELLHSAARMPVQELRRAAVRLADAAETADPRSADAIRGDRLQRQEQSAFERAELTVRKGLDGLATLRGTVPNLHADMLMKSLEAIAAPRRDHLRQAGRADGPDAPGGERERVPYSRRLGQALCELVEKVSERDLPVAAGANATIVVTVDEQALRAGLGTASLDTGDEVSVGEARRLACTAQIIPAVLGRESRPLDLGTGRRLFDRYQRIALAHRDGGCVFPSCERPPAWCEAHHAVPFSVGGPTDLANGALLCGFHHRLIHAGEWELRIAADGLPEAIPPTRIDPDRRPIRHERLRQRQRERERRRSRPSPAAGRP